MNVIVYRPPSRPLHPEDAQPDLYVCGACGRLAYEGCSPRPNGEEARAWAEQCCKPRICNEDGCDAEIEDYYSACPKHIAERQAARRASKIEHATEVEYDGSCQLYDDVGDGWYPDLETALDNCDDLDVLWPSNPRPVLLDRAEVLLEEAWDQAEVSEDCDPHWVGVDELKAAVEAFNKKQTEQIWYPDFTRVIRVPQPVEDEGEDND